MNIKHSVSFLLPSYNDAATIRTAVEEADEIGKKYTSAYEIVVINDGSSDQTKVILASLKKEFPTLIVSAHPTNKGYGATIKELYYKAKMEWCYSIPGDYQVGAKEIIKLMPFTHDADMIIGWRRHRRDPESRLRQSKIYNGLLQWFFQLDLHDVNSVRLMRTAILKDIRLKSASAFVDAELAILCRRRGYRIIEIPVVHRRQKTIGSGGSWRTIIPTIIDMFLYRLLHVA